MSGFLLDTNIPSELTRQKSDPQVEQWLDDANDEELYFSVVSLGEIVKGITVLPASKRREGLQDWPRGCSSPYAQTTEQCTRAGPSPPRAGIGLSYAGRAKN